MSCPETFSLLAASSLAGLVNAVAGGGTLVTFPVLLAFGVPPVVANATSTLSLVAGNIGSIYGYRNFLGELKPWLKTFVPASMAGGWIGSYLLTCGGEKVFSGLVPYLVLFATLLFMLQGILSRSFAGCREISQEASTRASQFRVALLFQFLVSVYGGYFGAGIGILMLATLGFLGFEDIHRMNSLKSVLGSIINLVAAAWFTASGLIDWPRMGLMTLGAFAGYYVGATCSQMVPQKTVRHIISAIGLIISVAMFWRLR
ncbi:MAG: sulfite exporter TauE/SafE family protein [bacterium]